MQQAKRLADSESSRQREGRQLNLRPGMAGGRMRGPDRARPVSVQVFLVFL